MHLRDFFYFQKSDRQVLLVALVVAVVAFALIEWVGRGHRETPPVDADSLAATMASGGQDFPDDDAPAATGELFAFDPNTADSTQLLRLGLQRWQVRNIYKYRSKGGVYRHPEDFAQVYGLTVGQYRRLAPYIRIGEEYRPAAEVYHRSTAYPPSSAGGYGRGGRMAEGGATAADGTPATRHVRDTLLYPMKLKAGETLNLNTADTTLLKKVPGIGSYYARRIVGYRERLGGFYDARQLLEIEGFPEESIAFFKTDGTTLRHINVNRMSLAQLRQHPYLNFYQAKAIVDYRRLKGPLRSIDDLGLLADFPPEALRRLAPYLEY